MTARQSCAEVEEAGGGHDWWRSASLAGSLAIVPMRMNDQLSNLDDRLAVSRRAPVPWKNPSPGRGDGDADRA